MINLIAASGLSLLGAIAFYMVSPHQQLLRKPMKKHKGYSMAVVALVLSVFLLLQIMAVPAASFFSITLLMLYLSLLPLVIAFVRNKNTKKALVRTRKIQ